jgi:dTMP kinase
MFIVFEGIDGCGKTTQIDLLKQYLLDNKERWLKFFPKITLTREPSGSAISGSIREFLLSMKMAGLDPYAELMLYCADRTQHVASVIQPALAEGNLVVSDRYTYLTIAYQGYGRDLSLDAIDLLNNVATKGIAPDYVFWIEIDPVTALNRLGQQDRIEGEGLRFLERVNLGYQEQFHANPGRIIKVDGNGHQLAIHNYIKDRFEEIFDILKTSD